MILRQFNYSRIKVETTESTNELLAEYKKSHSIQNGAVLTTENQTKGKGQSGNKWISEPGQNLTLSIFINNRIPNNKLFYLNIISALAIHKTLDDIKISSKIKWPNDIIVNHKKIAGILVENQIQGSQSIHTIVGIGLNVNQKGFEEAINATSIINELNIDFDKEEILSQLYQYLDFYLNLLVDNNYKTLEHLYLKQLYKVNETNHFEDSTGVFQGEIIGITENGLLNIQLSNGKRKSYDIQEIKYIQ